MEYSDYIVYVDESGDHGLESIDGNYPVFVLVFCIFKKKEYSENIVKNIINLKFNYLGHDQVILHEREIRKSLPPFEFLRNAELRNSFMTDVTQIITNSQFTLVAVAIDKLKLKKRYSDPFNPYEIALEFGLERVYLELKRLNNHTGITYFIIESRGKKEDGQLELTFLRSLTANATSDTLPFKVLFVNKKSNSTGLQFADLIARPIGTHIINPEKTNRAFNVIRNKFANVNGNIDNIGLKTFP